MSFDSIQGVILAAGQSRRFHTSISKQCHTLCGKEMITYPAQLLADVKIQTIAVVGYQKEATRAALKNNGFNDIIYVEQTEQRGTGHAVLCTQEYWNANNILIMNGDMPLVTREILEDLVQQHYATNAAISFVTCHLGGHEGAYGRVVREGNFIKIVEVKDFEGDISQHCWINAGVYLVQRSFLEATLPRITPSLRSNEIYLTDLVHHASTAGLHVQTTVAPFDALRGVNTLKELWIAEHIKRSELISKWMDQGVRFMAANNTVVDNNVHIESGTVIHAGASILTGSRIGQNCTIGTGAIIENATIEHDAIIHPYSIIKNTQIKAHAIVGPYAHISFETVEHANSSPIKQAIAASGSPILYAS